MKGKLNELMDKNRAKRMDWMKIQRGKGKSDQHIADVLGITRQRVFQLLKDVPRPRP